MKNCGLGLIVLVAYIIMNKTAKTNFIAVVNPYVFIKFAGLFIVFSKRTVWTADIEKKYIIAAEYQPFKS